MSTTSQNPTTAQARLFESIVAVLTAMRTQTRVAMAARASATILAAEIAVAKRCNLIDKGGETRIGFFQRLKSGLICHRGCAQELAQLSEAWGSPIEPDSPAYRLLNATMALAIRRAEARVAPP